MYCPSCGTAVIDGLNYCNRCGFNLSIVKGSGAAAPSKPSIDSAGENIFWTTVFCLGLILGGVVAMRALDVKDAIVVAYMVISSLAFIGLYVLDFWRIIQLQRSSQARHAPTTQLDKLDTKELDAASSRALPEHMPSVTEGATRQFEPSRKEQKTL